MISKRVFDLVFASLVLLLSAPFLAVAGILIRRDSPGPVLYRATRVGLRGETFALLKLRTMVVDADRSGPAVTVNDDSRVTAIGRHLRRLKLDELPQFLNVLRGEMSVVGPRPEHPQFVALYNAEQRRVLSVKPGITSLASLAYSDEASLLTGDAGRAYVEEVMPAKLALDLEYVDNLSLVLDLEIVGRTAALVLRRLLSRAA